MPTSTAASTPAFTDSYPLYVFVMYLYMLYTLVSSDHNKHTLFSSHHTHTIVSSYHHHHHHSTQISSNLENSDTQVRSCHVSNKCNCMVMAHTHKFHHLYLNHDVEEKSDQHEQERDYVVLEAPAPPLMPERPPQVTTFRFGSGVEPPVASTRVPVHLGLSG